MKLNTRVAGRKVAHIYCRYTRRSRSLAQLVCGTVGQELVLVLVRELRDGVRLLLDIALLLLGQFADERNRVSTPHLAAGDAPAGREHRAGLHDGVPLDEAALKQHGSRADDAIVLYCAGAQHRAVADRAPAADRAVGLEPRRRRDSGVDDRAVLDVCVPADRDRVDVRAHDGAIPDGGGVVDDHVADHGGTRRDEDIKGHIGLLLVQRHH
mmetsp:Transcript_20178/g.47686  ORF Transcript_20178/g.47686 Transcript_20178/m.47686 type:complete len:211 (-) Transcript_20178:165-797(-)